MQHLFKNSFNELHLIKIVIFIAFLLSPLAANAVNQHALVYPFDLSAYPPLRFSIWETLIQRIKIEPFNLFATIIFFCSIIHTFYHRYFQKLSERLRVDKKSHYDMMLSRLFHILGEVEVIFAIWLIPLFIGFMYCFGWQALTAYIDDLTFVKFKYVEPAFVVVVMCVSATRPVIQMASDIIGSVAKIFGGGVCAWTISVLSIGSLLGSLITEPAAITICAMILANKFFECNPSKKLKYCVLGTLLASISAGGTLTHFSAPPVLMVASVWNWDLSFMFFNFGLKAIVGIAISSFCLALFFKKEFKTLALPQKELQTKRVRRVPAWIVVIHLLFLAGIVISLHHPAMFFMIFVFFVAFVEVTHEYQSTLRFKTPLLVGIFLAALVTHGSLQGWWIEPVLKSLDANALFLSSILLTAFNDNAAITYLASLVPDFPENLKYLVVAGAVAGGGLTVIANAPNPAATGILKSYFAGGISPIDLLFGALFPTVIISLCFLVL